MRQVESERPLHTPAYVVVIFPCEHCALLQLDEIPQAIGAVHVGCSQVFPIRCERAPGLKIYAAVIRSELKERLRGDAAPEK